MQCHDTPDRYIYTGPGHTAADLLGLTEEWLFSPTSVGSQSSADDIAAKEDKQAATSTMILNNDEDRPIMGAESH